MREIILTASLLASFALSATAETEVAPLDSSRVYNLDEVVFVPRTKDSKALRLQPVSSSVLTGKEMSNLYARQ